MFRQDVFRRASCLQKNLEKPSASHYKRLLSGRINGMNNAPEYG